VVKEGGTTKREQKSLFRVTHTEHCMTDEELFEVEYGTTVIVKDRNQAFEARVLSVFESINSKSMAVGCVVEDVDGWVSVYAAPQVTLK
jgi:hypothetical protein